MDSIPTELLELQNRFETWRANRKYIREPIPDDLRRAVLELRRRYPPSLIHRVLRVDPARLKNKLPAKPYSATTAAEKYKPAPMRPARSAVRNRKRNSSPRAQVATLPQPAFFKLPAVAAVPSEFPEPPSTGPFRLQLERADGSRMTLTLPTFDVSLFNSLLADFLRSGKL